MIHVLCKLCSSAHCMCGVAFELSVYSVSCKMQIELENVYSVSGKM